MSPYTAIQLRELGSRPAAGTLARQHEKARGEIERVLADVGKGDAAGNPGDTRRRCARTGSRLPICRRRLVAVGNPRALFRTAESANAQG